MLFQIAVARSLETTPFLILYQTDLDIQWPYKLQ